MGLIDAGFMGKCHANAFRSAPGLFDLPVVPQLDLPADADDETSRRSAAALAFGFVHIGRFAGAFRDLFGERPSDILNSQDRPNSEKH